MLLVLGLCKQETSSHVIIVKCIEYATCECEQGSMIPVNERSRIKSVRSINLHPINHKMKKCVHWWRILLHVHVFSYST